MSHIFLGNLALYYFYLNPFFTIYSLLYELLKSKSIGISCTLTGIAMYKEFRTTLMISAGIVIVILFLPTKAVLVML